MLQPGFASNCGFEARNFSLGINFLIYKISELDKMAFKVPSTMYVLNHFQFDKKIVRAVITITVTIFFYQ